MSIDHVPFLGLARALRGGHISREGATVMLPLIAAGTVRTCLPLRATMLRA